MEHGLKIGRVEEPSYCSKSETRPVHVDCFTKDIQPCLQDSSQ
jgi:hypothetical protein